MTGVASTGARPLPTCAAVCSSPTHSVALPTRPGFSRLRSSAGWAGIFSPRFAASLTAVAAVRKAPNRYVLHGSCFARELS